MAADNRLDDKETLGDFWRREEFEMPGAMKKLKSGSRGCNDGKKEEAHADC